MNKVLYCVRHGQSLWNKENRFTGWVDIGLSQQGIEEAKKAAKILSDQELLPTVCHTSVLKRAIKTMNIILEETDLLWLPTEKNWRLNERHYGGLQGLNKKEMMTQYGEEQVQKWRRDYETLPPTINNDAANDPTQDPRYAHLAPQEIPEGESLKLTLNRVYPYWEDVIKSDLENNETPLIVAHGNSLRALHMHLLDMAPEDILKVNIPTGTPYRYIFDEKIQLKDFQYL